MKKLFITGLAAVSATLAACSEAPLTSPDGFDVDAPSFAVVPSGHQVCSVAGMSGWVLADNNPWTGVVPGGTWITPTATSDQDWPGTGPITGTSPGPGVLTPLITTTFEVPANATNVQINGTLLVDNEVFVRRDGNLIFQTASPFDAGNYNGSPDPFSGAGVAGVNNVTFDVRNWEGAPNLNPVGVNFCYTVTYTVPVANAAWCSPGYWKNADDAAWVHVGGIQHRNDLYNAVTTGTNFADNPTIWTVLNNPSTYKGTATNKVADYLAGLAGWTGTQASNTGCPLNNHGQLEP
jgi:hypothetical protein